MLSSLVTSRLLTAEAVEKYLIMNFSAMQLDAMAKDRNAITDATAKCVPDDDASSPIMLYVSRHVENKQNICYIQLVVRDYLYKRKKRAQQLAVANRLAVSA